ncbi:ElyC/SanA/YdcF family protein [Actinoplanes sp. NPDC026670]|uniref:ElyC/SanA/YdcF family protein n=1 Tax=Actinoplanes sp. NPDC026670 TaxID=3154700 RepID=UPI0033C7450B
MEFEVMPGTPGLSLSQVAHVLVPGHGRNHDASGLTPGGADRCCTALAVHSALSPGGVVVCSGYKSPADRKGETVQTGGETFQGVPEADLMRVWLLAAGADPAVLRVERHSVDTVTNLLRAEHEGHFGDDRPVAIVAQRGHLRRILSVVAPRTLRRPYLGVVVPGGAPRENPLAVPVSRLILAGLPADPATAITAATRRAERLWQLAGLLGRRSYH